MNWLKISTTVDPEAVESVSELLSRYIPGGIAIEEPYELFDDGQIAEKKRGEPVNVSGYLPMDGKEQELFSRIEEGLWHLRQIGPAKISEPASAEVAEEDWANTWKEFFYVSRIGKHIVIKPSWREYNAEPKDIIIELDPGMAFGTGLHPTTRMCLELAEQHIKPGDKILDIGTGSGILSIAATKLGAREILALEISSIAVEAARENFERNGIQGKAEVREATLQEILTPDLEKSYNVILANIIARVISELAPYFSRVIRSDGMLIASGIIAERLPETEQALREAGFKYIVPKQDGDWYALTCMLGDEEE